MDFTTESAQYIIFLTLIRLSFIVIVAAMLGNFDYFVKMLFSNHKSLGSRYKISLIICATLVIGIILRYSANYHALDISIPGVFIIGAVTGFLPSLVASIIISLVSILVKGEYLLAVMCIASALMGTLFFRQDIFGHKRKLYIFPLAMVPVSLLVAILYHYVPAGSMFTLSNKSIEGDIIVGVSDILGVFMIFFLWKYYKTRLDLAESAYNLNKTRLAILSSKINPHFLFNTLNTIASAIRIDPKIARDIVFKLSETMRYVLGAENEFKPLQDEINFIQNYLAIETLRFGETRLGVTINVDEAVKETEIPIMLIQPVIENAVKHGIAPLADRRGEIKINVYGFKENGEEYIRIDVEDNGTGMLGSEENIFSKGIGLSNVRDRIKLLYGDDGELVFSSVLGKGTKASIILPAGR